MSKPSEIRISDYTYELPNERIALKPLAKRDSSKLLVYQNGKISEDNFANVAQYLESKTTIVFNQTRVIHARLLFSRGEGIKPIEIFCLEPVSKDVQQSMAAIGEVTFSCFIGNAKKWKSNPLKAVLTDGSWIEAELVHRTNDVFTVTFRWNAPTHFAAILELAGHVPLPPYIKRPDEEADHERYQTVYAKENGSVAAPTAGLHFTDDVINTLKSKGIQSEYLTLHVGAGTFKPVSSEVLGDHDMHDEEVHIPLEVLEHLIDAPVITAVGTTSTRSLESAYWLGVKWLHQSDKIDHLYQWDAYELPNSIEFKDSFKALIDYLKLNQLKELRFRTQLLIAPGYKFRVIDSIITNFHQPGSTLILLVAAAIGTDWRAAYQFALERDFRFLSYGDSSILFIPNENKAKHV